MSAPASAPFRPSAGPWPAVVTLAAVVGVLVLRRPEAFRDPQLIAEDGTVFFLGAYRGGLGAALLPYNGYLHVLPRLVAWAGSAFDPAWVPRFYAGAALLVEVAVAALVFSPRIHLPAKPALALATAVVPHSGEVFLNLANLQWPAALALLLLLVCADAASVRQRWGDAGLALALGLTGPFSVFLAPLFWWRAARRSTRTSAVLAALVSAAGAVQLGLICRASAALPVVGDVGGGRLWPVMGARLFGTFWLGYGAFDVTLGVGAGLIALGGAWAVTLAWWPGPASRAAHLLAAAGLALALPVAAKFVGAPGVLAPPVNGDRYFFIPHVILLWLAVIQVAQGRRWVRWLAAVGLVGAAIGNVHSWRHLPNDHFAWAEVLQPVREGRAFAIPISPRGWIMVSRGKGPPSAGNIQPLRREARELARSGPSGR